ncbi:hypothetical protein EMPG_16998 [Blastomyces silverae]|uniref:Uncharacterized protein n=1 Tax=Blastomyces silverae TaxID=2060906 RepID=A0A0H1B8V4_9EURO|nr:hypothetical protein EMPG_16998 [Blastomyces silverae]
MSQHCSSALLSMPPPITSSARVLIAWMTRKPYSQSRSNTSCIASRICLGLDPSAPYYPAKSSA